jgi:hypothetical protein
MEYLTGLAGHLVGLVGHLFHFAGHVPLVLVLVFVREGSPGGRHAQHQYRAGGNFL